METTLVGVIVIAIVALLLFKMLKSAITLLLCLFVMIILAFYLRSEEVINFTIPEENITDIKEWNFSVDNKIKDDVKNAIKKEKESKEVKE